MPVRKVGESHKRLAELMAAASPECPPVWVGAEEPLFMLYTSGALPPPPYYTHTAPYSTTPLHPDTQRGARAEGPAGEGRRGARPGPGGCSEPRGPGPR